MSTSARPLAISRARYELTNYKRIDPNKQDLTRPYWSYEYYRCLEDAFLVYMIEETSTVDRSRLARAAGRSANLFRELYDRLTDRIAPVTWYFPNSQPIFPLYQSILYATYSDRDQPFGKPPRIILLAASAPTFYTLESFKEHFPDAELYPEDLSGYRISRIIQQHKEQQIKETVSPAEPEVSISKVVPVPESAVTTAPDKHPLYDPSDPPENTVSFAVRFMGCWSYNQLQTCYPSYAAGRLYANQCLTTGQGPSSPEVQP